MPVTRYKIEIEIAEPFSPTWAGWFEDYALAPLPAGGTLLRGTAADQAALHGLLERIRDLNIRLIHARIDAISD
jgi:hypothetical protein